MYLAIPLSFSLLSLSPSLSSLLHLSLYVRKRLHVRLRVRLRVRVCMCVCLVVRVLVTCVHAYIVRASACMVNLQQLQDVVKFVMPETTNALNGNIYTK